jgi:hypothetical protein
MEDLLLHSPILYVRASPARRSPRLRSRPGGSRMSGYPVSVTAALFKRRRAVRDAAAVQVAVIANQPGGENTAMLMSRITVVGTGEGP